MIFDCPGAQGPGRSGAEVWCRGFCYYHYWFGGKRLLERPVNEIIASGEPDFPFCLCWANESWTGIWHGAPRRMLMEQTYPGEADHRAHFEYLLTAFRDKRYITVDGRPMFVIYRAWQIPDVKAVLDFWNALADEAGIPHPFYVCVRTPDLDWNPLEHSFSARSRPACLGYVTGSRGPNRSPGCANTGRTSASFRTSFSMPKSWIRCLPRT
jgi:hypothetical protein